MPNVSILYLDLCLIFRRFLFSLLIRFFFHFALMVTNLLFSSPSSSFHEPPSASLLTNFPIVMKFTSGLPLLAALIAAVGTSATPLASRDVFVPPVLYPHAGTVWTVKHKHNVTWDTSNAPVNITNKLGRIMLRKAGLTTPVILQENFSILLGRIEVTVPWVVDGDDYQLVLFGDSGNFSPEFTITGS